MQPERYVLGELSEEQRAQYEAHFFDCLRCAEEVRAAAAFMRVARGILAEATGGIPSVAVEVVAVPAGRRRSVALSVVPGPGRGDRLHVLFAVTGLPPGSYVVSLGGINSPGGAVAAPDIARYQFTLRPPEE